MASTSTSESSIPTLVKCNDSIYSFHSPANHKIEIYFFHDIQWSLEYEQPHVETWMSTSTPRRPSVCWPKDWLKEKIPHARILSARYDGAMWKTDTGGLMTFYTIAENFMHDIRLLHKENCPIFLIGHGFGGLLIKKTIQVMSDSSPEPKTKSFLENVRGLFYFATPFLGSKAADSTKDLPYRGSLLKFLEVLNPEASQLNDWFRRWRKKRGCEAIAISPALPTTVVVPMGWRILQVLFCRRRFTHISEEPTTRFDINIFYTCAGRDHFNVCKPSSETDSCFQLLVSLVNPGILNPARNPGAHILKSSETEWTEFLESMTKQVEKQGRGTVFLPMRKLESKFSTVRIRLEEAGFKQRYRPDGAGVEIWGR